jgi:hypothetical protein
MTTTSHQGDDIPGHITATQTDNDNTHVHDHTLAWAGI